MGYVLETDGYGFTPGIKDGRDFFYTRKALLKVTSIHWAVLDTIIDLDMIDGYYQFKTPILLFLN